MKITIHATESLGVRGLCCSVRLKNRKILIDPGIALGYNRHGLLPHPIQIAIGARIQQKLIEALASATDVVFSHFDGDHIPLANPNPYQLGLSRIREHLSYKNIWAKGAVTSSRLEISRRSEIEKAIESNLPNADGLEMGSIRFSWPLPHGLRNLKSVSVMMSRYEEDGIVFVHASDVQLINKETIDKILDWKPDIVLSSGPPLYLNLLSAKQRLQVDNNAHRLAQNVGTLIIDHHLLRAERGLKWLQAIAVNSNNHVVCAAEFMGQAPLLLEAWREECYQWMPISQDWHKAYRQGETDLQIYLENGWQMLVKGGKLIQQEKEMWNVYYT